MTIRERTKQRDNEQTRKLIGGLRSTPEHGEVGKAAGAITLLLICAAVGAAAWQFALGAVLR